MPAGAAAGPGIGARVEAEVGCGVRPWRCAAEASTDVDSCAVTGAAEQGAALLRKSFRAKVLFA